MQPENNVSQSNENSIPGTKWQQQAKQLVRRRHLVTPWRHLVYGLQAKQGLSAKFQAVEQRVQRESSKPPSTPFDPHQYGVDLALLDRPDVSDEPSSPAPEERPGLESSSHFMLDMRWKRFLSDLLDLRLPAVQIYTNQAANQFARELQADAVTTQDKIFFRAGQFNPREPAGLALLGHELTHVAQARLEARQPPSSAVQQDREREALYNENRILQTLAAPSASASDPFGTLAHHQSDPLARLRRPPATVEIVQPSPPTSGLLPLTPVSVVQRPGAPFGSRPALTSESAKPAVGQGQLGLSTRPSTNSTCPLQTAATSRPVNGAASAPPAMTAPLSQAAPAGLSDQQLAQIKEAVYQDLMDRIRGEFERGG